MSERARYVVPIKTVVETAGRLVIEANSPGDALDAAERYCEELSVSITFGESITAAVDFDCGDDDLPVAPEEAEPDIAV